MAFHGGVSLVTCGCRETFPGNPEREREDQLCVPDHWLQGDKVLQYLFIYTLEILHSCDADQTSTLFFLIWVNFIPKYEKLRNLDDVKEVKSKNL